MDLKSRDTRTRSLMERFVDAIAVSHEPGLSHAQLMLTNYDLKPGECYLCVAYYVVIEIWLVVEPERRQWSAWNFVGFWIADSFNIVCVR